MIDIKLIRKNPEFVKRNLLKRNNPANLKMLAELIDSDEEWRENLIKLNQLRHERKELTQRIATRKKRRKDSEDLLRAKSISAKIAILEKKVRKIKENVDFLLMQLPNLLDASVPKGDDESENVEIRKWGKIPTFSFPVKDHIDIGKTLNILDIERAGKVAGSRFFYLKNEGVLLDLALINFALNEMLLKSYVPIEPPFFMRRKAYEGVVSFTDFKEVLYKIDGEDLYLIATSEHPIAAMFMNEVLAEKDLPLKFVGISTNFRKEAGAHGRDTRGIFRTHQFNKIEQFIFSKPEKSWKMHEELIQNAEQLVQKLRLPYRVVNVCTGDIGTVAAKKSDIEVWMPAQETYKEIISCSHCSDYQSRRLKIKYREKEGSPPKGFVHTLNSTALATGRTMVAILENYQENNSVIIPNVLKKYMNNIERLDPK